MVGPGVMIWSLNHQYKSRGLPIRSQGYCQKPVRIEDDVWIGAAAIVLPGVSLAQGTVVAAGAIVTKSTEPYSVVAGVPACPIGNRVCDDVYNTASELRIAKQT